MVEVKQDPVSFERAVSVEFIRSSGGYAVKAIRGQKEPARGWDPKMNSPAKSAQLLAEIERTDDNLGIHFHGDLVDVDVDGEDAHLFLVPALDAFLPNCSHVWGRKSRPRTHRAYKLKTLTKFDPTEHSILGRIKRIPEVKVEIRGGPSSRGEYSLLPSSIHPSGELYEWADVAKARATPTIVTPEDLIKCVRMAGAVAVLAPHWTEGLRQDLTMALSGFLHRAKGIADALGDDMFKINEDEALRFLEVLLSVTDDDPSDRVARRKAFEKTWAKAEKGTPVTGATRIEELTGEKGLIKKLYTLLTDNPDVAVIDDFTSRFAIWQGPALAIDVKAASKGAQKPFMTRQNFASSYGHKFVEINGKRRLLPEMLWSMSSARRVQGLTFEPSEDTIVSTPSGEMVNQWSGFEIPPYEGEVYDEDVERFTSYIKDVVCSGDVRVYEWVIAWLADMLKDPSNKAGTAMVLVGIEGAGKSFLGHEIIRKIIGNSHSVSTNSVENITKNFNIAYTKKIFIQCDEATNSRQKAVAARLKSLLTDPIQMVEPKGIDPYALPNYARFIFTSNDIEDAIYMNSGRNDRRYTVLEVSSRYVGMIEEYWIPFVDWLSEENTLAKIHKWLISQEYEKRLIKTPINTEARSRMQQASWDAFDAWLAEMLIRDHPLSEDTHIAPHQAVSDEKQIHGNLIERSEWPLLVEWNCLAEDFRLFKRRNSSYRNSDDLNSSHVGLALEKRGVLINDEKVLRPAVKFFDERKGVNVNKRVRLRTPPSREKINTYLMNKYGFDVKIHNRIGDEAGLPVPVSEPEEF